MNIGVNSFGLKKPFYRDWDGTLQFLKNCGISSLEVCLAFLSERQRKAASEGNVQERPQIDSVQYAEARAAIWGGEDAVERIKHVRAQGLNVFSAHVMFNAQEPEELLELIPQMHDFSRKTGVCVFVYSPSKTIDELPVFFPVYNRMCEELANDGIRFLLHNHEAECMLKDGRSGLELVFEQCPTLGLELDVGWAKFAGRDILELMDTLQEHLLLIHLKDIRADASPETRNSCYTAVGEGCIPLGQILQKAKELALGEDAIIIDQDASEGDILSDIARGVEHIRRLTP